MHILNPNLDVAAIRQEYQEAGSVAIDGLLSDDVAEAAYEALKFHVPWELHCKKPKSDGKVTIIRHEELKNLSDKEQQKLIPRIARLKDNDLSFAYNRYTIPGFDADSPPECLVLTRIVQYFNGPEYLKLMGDITGDHRGREVSTWASAYGPNHFLSIHGDVDTTQGRIAAHVLGMTRNWKRAWGGQFAFCDAGGKPTSLRVPQFNRLLLFKVPRLHQVNPVKPYARESRYSLFGWYKIKQEYFTGLQSGD